MTDSDPHVVLAAHLPNQRSSVSVRAGIMSDGNYVVGPVNKDYPLDGEFKEWKETGEHVVGFIRAGFLNWFQNHTAIGRGRTKSGIMGSLLQEYPTVHAEVGVDNNCIANDIAPPIIHCFASCQAGCSADAYYRVVTEEQVSAWRCYASCKFVASVKSGTPPFFKKAEILIGDLSNATTHLTAEWDDENNRWVITGQQCSFVEGRNNKIPVNRILPEGYLTLGLFSWEHSAQMHIDAPCRIRTIAEYVTGDVPRTLVNTFANNYAKSENTTDESFLKAEVKVFKVLLVP